MEDIKTKDTIEIKKIEKDKSIKITNSKSKGITDASMGVYDEDLNFIGFDKYPKVRIIMARTEEEYQQGIVVLAIRDEFELVDREYKIKVDGLFAVIYSVYAKTINDLRKPTIRQRASRVNGKIRRFFTKIISVLR